MPRSARFVSRVRWVAALVAVVATPRLAEAACTGFGPDFGQLLPNCGGGYCYVVSPGQRTIESLAGSFWSFGAGKPAVGLGTDNGTWPVTSWLLPSGSNLYFGGGWQASPAIDGCISGTIAPGKPAEIMVAAISDESTGVGFFAAASARRVTGAVPEFDFTFVAGGGLAQDIVLREIPRPRVLSATSSPLTYHLDGLALSDVGAGIYGDGSLAPAELVTGYRVYVKLNALSSLRTSAGWSPASDVLPLGQGFDFVVPPCPISGRIYLGSTVVFDGGFETAHVGRPLVAICRYCGLMSDADADGHIALDVNGDPECCPDPSFCGDCDDSNANVFPGAPERCDGLDNNCDAVIDNVALPGSVSSLQLARVPGAARLAWPPLAVAVSYDVVRGDLTELSISGGDFSSATNACLVDDVTASQVDDPEDPDPGYGFWYLLRAANCTGVGSYDDVDASQAAPRGAGIAASGHACP